MRLAIIAFTGISLGIIVGISSPNIVNNKERNIAPIMQSFTESAINSVGTMVNSNEENVTISFEEHGTRFVITPYTIILKIIPSGDFNKTKRTPISIKEISEGDNVHIVYTADENKLFADKIILLP